MKRSYENNNFNPNKQFRSSSSFLFSGGNCAEWSLIKSAIADKFRAEGVWDLYIKIDETVPYNINQEKRFLDPEPIEAEFIANKTQARATERTRVYDERRALIVSRIHVPAEQEEQLFSLDDEHLRAKSNDILKLDDYQKEFSSAHSKWETQFHYHIKCVASCNKVFSETLSPGVRLPIKELLVAGHFRKAWIDLNTRYSPIRGGADAQLSYIRLLESTIYNGGDLEKHLTVLNQYLDDLSQIDAGLTDQTRVTHLLNSMSASTNRDFQDTVNFHKQSRSNYLTFCDALRLENSKLLLDRATHKRDKRNQPQVNTQQINFQKSVKHCTKCDKNGHLAADCLSDKKCGFCGKTGHKQNNCFFDPKSPKYRPDFTQRSNFINNNLSSSSSPSGHNQVSLASNFKKKNKKPKNA